MINNKLNIKADHYKAKVLERIRSRGELYDGEANIEGIGLVAGAYYNVSESMVRFIPNIGSEFLCNRKYLIKVEK